jgi:hypothetical protein
MDCFVLAQIGIYATMEVQLTIHLQWHYIGSIPMGGANQNTHTMNLIYTTTIGDTYNVYSEDVNQDGKLKTIYYAECNGWSSGKYTILIADTYYSALRILAKLK